MAQVLAIVCALLCTTRKHYLYLIRKKCLFMFKNQNKKEIHNAKVKVDKK